MIYNACIISDHLKIHLAENLTSSSQSHHNSGQINFFHSDIQSEILDSALSLEIQFLISLFHNPGYNSFKFTSMKNKFIALVLGALLTMPCMVRAEEVEIHNYHGCAR